VLYFFSARIVRPRFNDSFCIVAHRYEAPTVSAALASLIASRDTEEGAPKRLAHADAVRDAQSTLLLKRKQQLAEVEACLDLKRADFNKRMSVFQERREDLTEKQRLLHERATKFEQFLRESDNKRKRVVAKAEAERKLRLQRAAELEGLQRTLANEAVRAGNLKRILGSLWRITLPATCF
jgi:hypothetical protein